jgi:hypothetical protein
MRDAGRRVLNDFGLESNQGEAAIRTFRAMSLVAWQTIETAPKDGSRILGINERGEIEICAWEKEPDVAGWYTNESEKRTLVYWCPIPETPF